MSTDSNDDDSNDHDTVKNIHFEVQALAAAIDVLQVDLQTINAKLDLLLHGQKEVKENTVKMSTHIDFINCMYNQLRSPLKSFLSWTGYTQLALPSSADKHDKKEQ